ncbi:MAG: hypothetical protein K2H40_11490 [Lachnospiraceae bacterium]|nr:hypothetical protein [Lachnospiraceae bacterium]
MRKKEWKKELRRIFEPPEPMRKMEFIRELERPGIGLCGFIVIQVGYIRKWVWLASAFAFFSSLFGAAALSADMLWWISAWMPLLALTIVAESGRSESYGMAEMEMATRFSLKSILLARLGILGAENMLLLCLLLPIGLCNNLFRPMQAGLYMLTPFLLTAFLGLSVMRRFRGQEASYLCIGITIVISLVVIFVHDSMPQLYGEDYLLWWGAVAAALSIGTVKQYYQFINRMEELQWNLS